MKTCNSAKHPVAEPGSVVTVTYEADPLNDADDPDDGCPLCFELRVQSAYEKIFMRVWQVLHDDDEPGAERARNAVALRLVDNFASEWGIDGGVVAPEDYADDASAIEQIEAATRKAIDDLPRRAEGEDGRPEVIRIVVTRHEHDASVARYEVLHGVAGGRAIASGVCSFAELDAKLGEVLRLCDMPWKDLPLRPTRKPRKAPWGPWG